MQAQLHIPSFPLNQFIESFFYYTEFNPAHALDRFLPDGNVYMVFDLRDEPKFIYDNQTLEEIQVCRRVWFSGFRTEPITIPSGRESEMLVVTFLKGKAAYFLREPLPVLTNYTVDAERVLGKEILDIRYRMKEAGTIWEKFEILEKGLLANFLGGPPENPFVDFMLREILNGPDQTHLKEIVQKIGYSQKHMIKIFKDNVGVTPKHFLKVIRFQKAIAEIEARQQIQWTNVAFDCGFYDQSHFIADFKTFSGWTPTAYLKQRRKLLNYIPIAE